MIDFWFWWTFFLAIVKYIWLVWSLTWKWEVWLENDWFLVVFIDWWTSFSWTVIDQLEDGIEILVLNFRFLIWDFIFCFSDLWNCVWNLDFFDVIFAKNDWYLVGMSCEEQFFLAIVKDILMSVKFDLEVRSSTGKMIDPNILPKSRSINQLKNVWLEKFDQLEDGFKVGNCDYRL